MPPPARRPDPQTDYEDPIDRLYRRRSPKKPDKDSPPDKIPSATANVAYVFGLIGLVPCLGALVGPIAVLLGILGLVQCRNPNVSGKGKAKSGLWFGMIALAINYFVPLVLYLYFGFRGGFR